MLSLTQKFYQAIVTESSKFWMLPTNIKNILYDPRFTKEAIIALCRKGRDDLYFDTDHYYRKVFNEIQYSLRSDESIVYICDSSDINEDEYSYGDYSYYAGLLTENVPFLYQAPSHDGIFPDRVVFYGPQYIIEVRSDKTYIDVYEAVQDTRNRFLIDDVDERILSIKDLLRNSNRPRLYTAS